MRKLISACLLVFLLCQSVSIIVFFPLQRRQIQREVKQRLKAGVPEDELVLFKLPFPGSRTPDNIEWLNDHEFRYEAGLYDVVRVERHGESTWYYCLSDTKETQLFANLDRLATEEMRRSARQRKQNRTVERLLSSLLFSQRNHLRFIVTAKDAVFPEYQFGLKTWSDSPSSPPPRA